MSKILKNEKNKIELLIPVGGKEQLIAAVENGADAVYLGGTAFNARISAENFNLEIMQSAVAFCHLRGVKVYVTINTLMRDDQLKMAVSYALKLHKIGVDAFIIQDLGFGELIRRYMPNQEIHLSTQGTVYGKGGAMAVKELGYSRVVLAREMPLRLIEEVSKCGEIETEVFVHGALCFCYSGQCHLSRSIGGRSGNQGVCAQPCRLPYKLDDEKVTNYHISPKDLCLIDHLGSLIDAGVDSLKVEGRLKSPQYVAGVTSIYRKYIDEYYKNGTYRISDEDRGILLQIFNRGGFTDNYILGKTDNSLISMDFPKNRGIHIGTVQNSRPIKSAHLINAKLAKENLINQGDVVEARYKTSKGDMITESSFITYIKNLGNKEVSIGDFKKSIPKGSQLYKVISNSLNEKYEGTFKNKDFEKGKYIKTTPIDFKLIRKNRMIELVANTRLFKEKVNFKFCVEGDLTPRNNTQKIKQNLGKLGGTPFTVGNIEIIGEIPIGLKISDLNFMRREILNRISEKVKGHSIVEPKISINNHEKKVQMIVDEDILSKDIDEIIKRRNILNKTNKEVYFYNLENFIQTISPGPGYVALLPIAGILVDEISGEDMDLLAKERGYSKWIPYVSNVSMGKEDEIIKANKEQAVALARGRGVYLGNLQWFDFFKSAQNICDRKLATDNFSIYGDFGLNAYNSASFGVLNKLGFQRVEPSSETYNKENGAFPLMVAEHIVNGETLTDRKGVKYFVVKRPWSSQMIMVKNGTKWNKIPKGPGRIYFYTQSV
ncbi:U32 family peptidase [Eubacteriales bacterium KG127]